MKSSLFIYVLSIIFMICTCRDERANPIPSNPGMKSSNEFILVAVGDIVHPQNWHYAREYIKLGRKMFAPTRKIIKSGDLSFANLEGPFTYRKPLPRWYYRFTVLPSDLNYTLWAGFNLFSLANNHMYDADKRGITKTLKLLEEKTDHQNIEDDYSGRAAAALQKKQNLQNDLLSQGKTFVSLFFHIHTQSNAQDW